MSAGGSDTREGAANWPPRGPGESRLRPQDGVPLVGRVKLNWWQARAPAGAEALVPEGSGSRVTSPSFLT